MKRPKLPPEVRLMIWGFFLDQEMEEPPRIYQLRYQYVPPSAATNWTSLATIRLHGDHMQAQAARPPAMLSVAIETRRLALQRYYVQVADVPPGTPDFSPRGGLWLRRGRDVVYVDAALVRALPFMGRFNLRGIERVAVDVQVLNEPNPDRRVEQTAMARLVASLPSLRHMVFFAPTRPNPPGNYYRGLRLVDREEDDASKALPCE